VALPEASESVSYPGARRPDRRYGVDSYGLRLATYEWGDASAPPVLLNHGGFDFAGTWDGFAPLLADAGWRVVAFDQRGHGDSEHAALYSWPADMRDLKAVLDSIGPEPIAAVGHSKGGSQLTDLIHALPHRISRFVNIDGLPSDFNHPDVAEHERTRRHEQVVETWLDWRRRTHDTQRRPGTLDELAKRRGRMNPRLSHAWLRYLVSVGARRDPDGWRWKIDPSLRFGGFGPWRPSWSVERARGLTVPLLGIIGTEHEEMGWGATADSLHPHLPSSARLEVIEATGHFVHIETPERVAELVLDFFS
jgi:pimeloyl-ACP methyl ester carboxylesterase